MRKDQIDRVQQSFRLIQEQRAEFAALFYRHLFAFDSSARDLFLGVDLYSQQDKLMATLEVVVANLYNMPKIEHAVRELGARHVNYGVTKLNYDKAGAALLQTIEDILGPACDSETRESWQYAYDLVSFMMRSATSPAEASP